nr:MAG TPA: endopeptidase tail [Caudoviricetes sp.]
MYLVYVGDQFIHDAYSDDRKVHDGKLSGDVNTFLTLEFTVPPTNPMAKSLTKRDYAHPVTATFDGQRLFRGYIETTEEQLDTEVKVTCKGDLAMLNDSIVRPYTTQQGDTNGGMQYIGQGYETLFKWFIGQHNANVVYRGTDGQEHGTEKRFQIKYPSGSNTSLAKECAILDKRSGERPYSQSKPTTLGEIQSKITKALGAYLQLWYDGDVKCLALYANVPEVLKNDQVIQFGRNMTDYMFEDSCVDTYTAIRAQGGNDANSNPVTLKGIADGVKSSAYYKRGDVVYHMANAEKYGYREYAWSNSDITDANTLLGNAIVQLQKIMTPAQSIDVSAMDMVFVSGKYKHLLPGQLVTVQSYAHDIDVELLVSSCNIDFDSPDSTKYTMGSSASRITKTYGSIMEEITANMDKVDNAVMTASTAQQTAQQMTAVTIRSQGAVSPVSLASLDTDAENTVIMPADGISISHAVIAATASMRQLYIKFSVADVIQSNIKLGTIQDMPAAPATLIGLTGYVNTDGTVIVEQGLKPGILYEISVVFVIGVTSV